MSEPMIFDMNEIQVADTLGVGRRAVKKLIESRRLSVRRIPGSYPRFSSDEVRRLAVEFTEPAQARAC